jgi:hypothetical protein
MITESGRKSKLQQDRLVCLCAPLLKAAKAMTRKEGPIMERAKRGKLPVAKLS